MLPIPRALTVLLVGTLFAIPTFAAEAPADEKPTQLEPIRVVGTRLSAPDLAAAGPVVTIDRAQIEASGFTQIGELINSLTFLGAARNTHFNANGTGRVLANIHNLGASRTLVLVNGQRWIPTVGGPVDLTTIPLAIVQRVEVLLDGASAIYGSDAIAGVINIVTVRNFSGAEAGGMFGGYDAHGAGGGFDGKTRQVHFTVGTADDRSAVLLGAGYSNADPVFAGDRDISRYPVYGFGNQIGDPVTPDGHLILETNNTGPFAGLCTAGGGAFTYHCDLAGPLTSGAAHPFTSADLYNYATESLIKTGQERWHIYSQGHYDLADWVTFSYMTVYERRNATEITPPGGWSIGVTGRTRVAGLPVGISATNIYNPFNMDLVPAAPGSPIFDAWCAQYGTGAGGGCTSDVGVLSFLGIRPLAQGNSRITQNLNSFYFNGGFNGGFPLFGNPWHWNVHYAYGQSLETEVRNGGHTFAAALQAGLGPAQACATTPGCVPLDFFHGSGGVTKEMLDYTNFQSHFTSQAIIRDYNAGLGGPFFNGWYAGPWQLAAGYEYVQQFGLFEPGAAVVNGLYIGFPIQPTKGSTNANSQYAELGLPLASDLPFAKAISLNLAMRFTQAEWSGQPGEKGPTIGGSGHASSGRVGFKWQLNDHVLFRATWSQGYRVPTISELFSAQSLRPQVLSDPCVANQLLPPAQQLDLPNCPNNGHSGASQPTPDIPVLSGGNPNLDPERSLTRTLGIVWSPSFAPGLSVSADYYKIEIVNAVSDIGAQALLDGCYLETVSSYCAPIVRENGIIQVITATRFNAGSLHTNGWDVGIHYVMPATPIGVFTADFSANFTKFLIECDVLETPAGIASRCTDSAGEIHVFRRSVAAVPKRRMVLRLGWNYGNWAANWNMSLIGPMYERCSDSLAVTASTPPWSWCSNNAGNTNRLGTTVYNDVQASYTVAAWDTTFTLGVNNVLDRDPPVAMTYSPGMFLPVYYRIPGRFVYGRVSVRF
ncbi:MAG: TonB-dependent receptor [Gammaproteobacteria bacterium]|nr:TonB-dependent receptor [Gammaproteobacteria bacterium]